MKRFQLEDDKQRAELRRVRFEMSMADWEVEKWEHQLELIKKELEEHDKSLALLQQAGKSSEPAALKAQATQ
ncbi:hypothetical protein HK104_001291 [Borealophlyctis nickersoniae]|nr:hypothetical protein HK104_001291 [Borealophlyctis nickersoniae]